MDESYARYTILGWDRYRPASTTLYTLPGGEAWTGSHPAASILAATLTARHAEGLSWKPLPADRSHHHEQSRHRTRRSQPERPW